MQELRHQSIVASYCLFAAPVEPFRTAGYYTVMQVLRRQSIAASYCLFATPVEPFRTAGYSTIDARMAPPGYRPQVTACLLHL